MFLFMIAKGSEPILISFIILTGISLIFIPFSWFVLIPFFAFIILTSFTIFFFRDPLRISPSEEGFIAPVDGKIVGINELKHEMLQIQIEISLFDVHVNRAPIDSKVLAITREKGAFWPVWFRKKYENANSRQHFDLELKDGIKMQLTQIAGALAWRCVSYVNVGDILKRNDRIGIIRFGSAMRLTFPKKSKYQPIVKIGAKVKSGETIIAKKQK